MTEEETARAIKLGAFVGLATALVGFIEGIVLMFKSRPGRCDRGTYDEFCTVHPHLAGGLALSAISVSGAMLILLVAYVAIAVSRSSGA